MEVRMVNETQIESPEVAVEAFRNLHDGVYCSTFCNFGHNIATGKPVDHECARLNVVKFALEREGRFDEIVGSIQATGRDPGKDKNE